MRALPPYADVTAMPSQFKVTKQILLHWQPFRDLKLKYVGSRQAEQLSSRSQQRVETTVEESEKSGENLFDYQVFLVPGNVNHGFQTFVSLLLGWTNRVTLSETRRQNKS